jgi:ATP-dependent RNA helicase MSS116
VLILSPTRELALQIEEEAKTLLAHHPFQAQHAIGGTNINSEKNRLKNERCDILIATPGRLLDHLENGHVKSRLENVQSLILDEADRLLDQGFLNDLEKIFTFLPSRKQVPRQAMLFSATMSSEVKQVVSKALSGNHTFVSTLTKEEANTHEHVPQSFLTAPLSDTLASTLAVVRDDIATHGKASKIMIFCPTARSTALSAEVFRQIKDLPPILEIHSRKTQANRSKAAEAFKDAKTGILFSSDVAARGMDFPGVTLVIQAGLPSSAEQYVHRLGRTARAGASGRGILILCPFERFFLQQKEVKTFNIRHHKELSSLPKTEIDAALQTVDQSTKAQAYVAWMGYYSSWLKKMSLTSTQLVEMANAYVMEVLFYRGSAPPPILAKTVGMMGLKGTPGLHIVKSKEQLVHSE